MTRSLHVAVCGATGAAGREMLSILAERRFPCASITALASARSAGSMVPFGEGEVYVKELTKDSFKGVDLALFATGEKAAREFAPHAQAAGCVVVDTSSAWRMDERCPLVVPEVNPDALDAHNGIIACPGSAAIQMLVALKPLHDAAHIRRIVVTTMQAVSGSGQKGVGELERQVRRLFNMQQPEAEVYPHQIAFNCLPRIGEFMDGDCTAEEMNLAGETRRMLGDGVKVSATCVRVPVFYGHSESINIETEKKLAAAEARVMLMDAPGVQVADNPRADLYPLAIDASGEDDVFVGRIREDESRENALNLWVVADNVRKGMALNAVQAAEELLKRELVSVPQPGVFLEQ
ncbi:MAG: aspartate-semialdehyde dehydrogenase [Mailhella sp.]|nr:aspartate-semialdehyde dehydrogenase [Mailhella sp.]